MLYKVQASFIKGKEKEFHQKLTDGTIKKQWPDGSEIIASMIRSKINPNGLIVWTETCFCPTPLAHERSTIYDNFFTDMKTEVISKHEDFEGKSFMDLISQ